jgi:hypothetical protein
VDPVIPEAGRLEQEDQEFKTSLVYIDRPFPEKEKRKTTQVQHGLELN